MLLPERLIVDPEILAGKPIVRGSRLAAEFIIELLAAGMTESDILSDICQPARIRMESISAFRLITSVAKFVSLTAPCQSRLGNCKRLMRFPSREC
jgi:hypothetical protein